MTQDRANQLYNILYRFMDELKKDYICDGKHCDICRGCALCSLVCTAMGILEDIE